MPKKFIESGFSINVQHYESNMQEIDSRCPAAARRGFTGSVHGGRIECPVGIRSGVKVGRQ